MSASMPDWWRLYDLQLLGKSRLTILESDLAAAAERPILECLVLLVVGGTHTALGVADTFPTRSCGTLPCVASK